MSSSFLASSWPIYLIALSKVLFSQLSSLVIQKTWYLLLFQYRISHENTKAFTVFLLTSQTYKPSAGMKFLFTTLTFIPHALQVRHW